MLDAFVLAVFKKCCQEACKRTLEQLRPAYSSLIQCIRAWIPASQPEVPPSPLFRSAWKCKECNEPILMPMVPICRAASQSPPLPVPDLHRCLSAYLFNVPPLLDTEPAESPDLCWDARAKCFDIFNLGGRQAFFAAVFS